MRNRHEARHDKCRRLARLKGRLVVYKGEDKTKHRAVRRHLLPKLDEPDWPTWSSIPNAELWEVVALACNIDPGGLIGWIEPRPITDKILTIFHNRLREAVAGLKVNGGELPSTFPTADHRAIRVELGDFHAWASSKGWQLPANFPDFPAKHPQRESPSERKARLTKLVDAELRKGKSKKEAIAIVASSEPNHWAKREGETIGSETLRKILERK
jgi:hypothetical protein